MNIGKIYIVAAIACVYANASMMALGYPGDPGWLYLSENERKSVERVQSLIHLGEYDSAWDIASQAVREFPNGLESHIVRIQAARAIYRMDLALKSYVAMTSENPDNHIAWCALAFCYYQVNDSSGMEIALQKAQAARTGIPQIEHLELLLLRMTKPGDSRTIALGESLRRRWPDYARAYISEIRFRLKMDNAEYKIRSLIHLGMKLPIPPADLYDFEDELNMRSLWYDPAKALPLLDQALRTDPSRMDLALKRGFKLQSLGRMEEARGAIAKIVSAAPRLGQPRLALARILMDLQQYNEALQVLEEGLKSVRHQNQYPPAAIRRRAEALQRAGRLDEAELEIRRLMTKYPASQEARGAQPVLLNLLARKAHEKVHIIAKVPFLEQKGNYCGPASLSMILGFWNDALDQDSIASEIYTGVAGTSPQVVREYAKTRGYKTAYFEGGVESWKKLLDNGIPILWLKMLRGGGAHYMVVAGYDDVNKEFILHNPHHAWETVVAYGKTRDEWLLPSLQQSIALIPEGSQKINLLSNLIESTRLKWINRTLYIMTGSNLYRGAWPAALINTGLAAALAAIALFLISGMVCPNMRYQGILFFSINVLGVFALNYYLAQSRSGQAVSLLLAYYLVMISLFPILLLCRALRRWSHDWFHPREILYFIYIVYGAWCIRAFMDDGYWQDRIPPVLIFAGAIIIVIPRIRMNRMIDRARHGPCASPANLLGEYVQLAPDREISYSAALVLIEMHIGNHRGGEALDVLFALQRQRKRWPRGANDLFDLLRCTARIFDHEEPISCRGSQKNQRCSTVGCPGQAGKCDDIFDSLSSKYGARTSIGAVARALHAFSRRGLMDDHTRKEICEVRQYLIALNRWPWLPGISRSAYTKLPHLLIRILPLVLDAAEMNNVPEPRLNNNIKDEEYANIQNAICTRMHNNNRLSNKANVQPLFSPLEASLAALRENTTGESRKMNAADARQTEEIQYLQPASSE